MAAAGERTIGDVIAHFDNWPQDISGLPVSDSGWLPAAIYEKFLSVRASDIIEEQTKDMLSVNHWSRQTIGCMKLEEVRVEDCPCAPPSGCTWFKTQSPIPATIGPLLAVTSIGGNLQHVTNFTYRDWNMVKLSLQARLPAERNRPYYTIRNNYIYVIQREHLKAISISGVFYDPAEVYRTNFCEGTVDRCARFMDLPLYIDPGKYQKLLLMTTQDIVSTRGNAPLDTTNNAQPPTGIEPPKPY